jgi:hypothetical protein
MTLNIHYIFYIYLYIIYIVTNYYCNVSKLSIKIVVGIHKNMYYTYYVYYDGME